MNESEKATNAGGAVTDRQKDIQQWKREWLMWLAASLILTAIWGVRCLIRGELGYFWPVWAIGIWFLFVALAPLLPSRRSSADQQRV